MRRELPTTPPAAVRPADDLADLAAAINAEVQAGDQSSRRGVEHYRAAGLKLIEAKRRCGHGAWLGWLRANVRVSQQHASRYMRLAKLPTVSDLEVAWAAITGRADDDDEHVITEAPAPAVPASTSAGGWGDDEDEGEVCKFDDRGRIVPADMDDIDAGRAFTLPAEVAFLEGEQPDGEVAELLHAAAAASEPAAGRLGKPGEFLTIDDWRRMGGAERAAALAADDGRRFNDQGDNDNIEWALWSWNPVTGCEHNCPYCYARDIATRFYAPQFAPALWPARLHAPRNTPFPAEKAAAWMGHKNVFTCSMADLFGRWVPAEWIEAVLAAVRDAPQWNFLFLTKFPIRLSEFEFPDNAWVGTSVDCQARVANAEKAFRKVKAGVKWLSCEPLIEPLTFSDLGAFDWVVLGGASRSSRTPEWHPPRPWVQAIEDEADRLGVKVYEKSNLFDRVRQYPGVDPVRVKQAPDGLRYLARVEGKP